RSDGADEQFDRDRNEFPCCCRLDDPDRRRHNAHWTKPLRGGGSRARSLGGEGIWLAPVLVSQSSLVVWAVCCPDCVVHSMTSVSHSERRTSWASSAIAWTTRLFRASR